MRRPLCTIAVLLALWGCEQERETPTPEPPAPAPTTDVSAKPAGAEGDEPEESDEEDVEPAEDGSEVDDSQQVRKADLAEPDAQEDGSTRAEQNERVEVGAKKVESQYTAWLQGQGRYRVGKPSTVEAVLTAKGDLECNDAYPYKFEVGSEPSGITFPATTMRSARVGKQRTTLTVPFTPKSAGAKTIRGTFHFSVCNASTCKIEKQLLEVTLDVDPD